MGTLYSDIPSWLHRVPAGAKLLVLLLMLAATLTPNLGEWLHNFVGVLRI